MIGPFADYGAAAHDDVFAPEVRCDFAAEQRGVYGTVRWKPLQHFDEWEDRLDLDLHARHTACGYYAATMLNAPGECEALLEIEIGARARFGCAACRCLTWIRAPEIFQTSGCA